MNQHARELSDFILASKYLRYNPTLNRRETYDEAIDRLIEMHLKYTPKAGHDDLKRVEEALKQKRIMPSMRSLQYGGPAIEAHNMRMYNCVGTYINKYDLSKSLGKIMYCLMAGSGVGFRLPSKDTEIEVPKITSKKSEYVIEDSIVGWADSIEYLIRSLLYEGSMPVFRYSEIRPEGSVLVTGGGKAPGPEPLRIAHEQVTRLLMDGSSCTNLDIYDCIMFIAGAVLSGGVRRSATIALFDSDDMLISTSKVGDWFNRNPQRSYSNNSGHFIRGEFTKEEFRDHFRHAREFGEPGIYIGANEHTITNPCGEITFDGLHKGQLSTMVCNLTTINAAEINSRADFIEAAELATILGTIQSQYTDFSGSEGHITALDKEKIDKERLLGVSICGILDKPHVLLDPEVLRTGALRCILVNEKLAPTLGVDTSARLTTVKPEGTASLVLGSSAGIHPRHGREYLRRVQVNVNDDIGRYYEQINPEAGAGKSVYDRNSFVLEFPIEAPPEAIVKDDLTALAFLDIVKTVKENWCIANPYHPSNFVARPHTHNVSNTIHVKDHEWENVENYIFEHQNVFSGISVLPFTGDGTYPQAPEKNVVTIDEQRRFKELKSTQSKVDYTKLYETEDHTDIRNEFACIGGSCTI